MLKQILFSKRTGGAVAVIMAYFVSNPQAIADLGVPMVWQIRIVALFMLGTKVYDELKKPA